jgi:cytidine deaminase
VSGRTGRSAEEVERLVAAARSARRRAYAPYSGFHVGAAVLAEGRIYSGVNVENASYPLSVCAERNAVAAAIRAGRRRIEAVAVVAGEDRPTPPCGGCRQVLHEFGPEMLVISETVDGRRSSWPLRELLPAAFDRSSFVRP